jgi:phage regulator Rha-like protein
MRNTLKFKEKFVKKFNYFEEEPLIELRYISKGKEKNYVKKSKVKKHHGREVS